MLPRVGKGTYRVVWVPGYCPPSWCQTAVVERTHIEQPWILLLLLIKPEYGDSEPDPETIFKVLLLRCQLRFFQYLCLKMLGKKKTKAYKFSWSYLITLSNVLWSDLTSLFKGSVSQNLENNCGSISDHWKGGGGVHVPALSSSASSVEASVTSTLTSELLAVPGVVSLLPPASTYGIEQYHTAQLTFEFGSAKQ